jgi:hypothetical protein
MNDEFLFMKQAFLGFEMICFIAICRGVQRSVAIEDFAESNQYTIKLQLVFENSGQWPGSNIWTGVCPGGVARIFAAASG